MRYPDPYQSGQGQHLSAPVYGHPQQGWGPPAPQLVVAPKSAGAAIVLEIVLGLFGIFGVGNIYAGKVATGIVLMLTFWVTFWINFLLVFIVIGWVTMPMTWLAYLAVGAILAARGVEQYNARILAGYR
ncbi:hypothetical protein [Micromonospora sp. LOL_023]|uniref:hypothetical protein n=1 Tax=Micromonospora sp. LOL_023 TaxID=3345418 RepID=UPI003A8793D1